jgi:arylformamidase
MDRGQGVRSPSRRALLAGSASMVGIAAAAAVQAQQSPGSTPARSKGPAVWLDLDQKALDDAYDQSVYAPNQKHVNARRNIASQMVRDKMPPQRLSYGASEIEKLDFYRSKRRNAPIQIFVHGGAWRAGLAKDHAIAAEMAVNAGAHYVVLDFINVIESGGDLMPMIDQVRRGIAWVAKNARRLGGDPNRIYISGHSSGAHLAGVATITDWKKDHGLPGNVVKGAVLCSGMYDLKPVRLSARSNYVKFNDAMEHALSTQRHLARIGCPLLVAHGTLETPEFQRQAREFVAAVKAAGKNADLIVGEGFNHFELPETFASPYGILGRAMLRQMRLG